MFVRMVRVGKVLSASLAMLFAAACATQPNDRAQSAKGFSTSLKLCDMRVSNAPSTDRAGRVARFDPFIVVRGVSLARAPVTGCLSSGFGKRRGGAGSLHKGIDLYTGGARPIYAAGDGRIVQLGSQRGFGRTVLIRHRNGVETRYAHLSDFASGLKIGSKISAGSVIGRTGSTGNATGVHLHYEILVSGKAINPLQRVR